MGKVKKPQFDLEGKVALVTGAVGGIGRAVCNALAAAGANIYMTDTTKEKLEDLSCYFREKGIQNNYMAVDLREPGAPEKLIRSTLTQMGRLDILINSAGINRPQLSVDVTPENWDAVLDINLKCLFFMCQAAGREMIKNRSGCIINISSQAGIVALPLRAPYCSSKGGVNQLTRVLAMEWAKYNIRVNAVAPTFVNTPFVKEMFKDESFKNYVLESIPMGRMATPEEVAYTVLFLACDFVQIITGHVLVVDGGWTIK